MSKVIFALLSDQYGVDEATWNMIYDLLVADKRKDMAMDIDKNLQSLFDNRVCLTRQVAEELQKCYQ